MSYDTDPRTIAAARRFYALSSTDGDPTYDQLPKPHRTDLCWKAAQILAASHKYERPVRLVDIAETSLTSGVWGDTD